MSFALKMGRSTGDTETREKCMGRRGKRNMKRTIGFCSNEEAAAPAPRAPVSPVGGGLGRGLFTAAMWPLGPFLHVVLMMPLWSLLRDLRRQDRASTRLHSRLR